MPRFLKSLKIRALCVTVELFSFVYTTVQIMGLHYTAAPKNGKYKYDLSSTYTIPTFLNIKCAVFTGVVAHFLTLLLY